jgi:hypothetical protein
MSWWNHIFPSSKSAEKMIDAATKGVDAVWYTEEEKAATREKMRDWYLKLLDSMQAYNVAMRALAFIVGGIWAIHLLIATSLYVLAAFICPAEAESCRSALAARSIDEQLQRHINEPFFLVMMFYFGAAGINGAIRTWNDKKGSAGT